MSIVGLAFGSFWRALLRPKGDLEIHAPFRGNLVRLWMSSYGYGPLEELAARQVRVELVGSEVYYTTGTTHTYGTGTSTTTTTTSKTKDSFTLVRRVLQEPSYLRKGVQQRWKAPLQLPIDAPPTCKGGIIDVNWTLRVVVDVPRRRDLVQKSPLTVLAEPRSDLKVSTRHPDYLSSLPLIGPSFWTFR